jgi:16S rRNA (cytosine1402-N4)-methyltransferase
MRTANVRGEVKKDFYGNIITPLNVLTRKAIIASEEEVRLNKRARSARLRIAERKAS